MTNYRLTLIAILAFLGLLLWQSWQTEHAQNPAAVPTSPVADPSAQAPVPTDVPAATLPAPASTPVVTANTTATVHVGTDVYDIDLSLQGGQFIRGALARYPTSVDTPEEGFPLFDVSAPAQFQYQSGLLGSGTVPDHLALYQSAQSSYEMGDAQTLSVPLTWRGTDGLTVTKTYHFTRGSYVVDVTYDITNPGPNPLAVRPYQQLSRVFQKRRGFIYTFTGVAVSTPDDRYKKYDYDDLEDQNLEQEVTNGWVAMLQHYFVAALIPPQDSAANFYTRAFAADKRYLVGSITPATTVPAGGTASVSSRLYFGPKLHDVLPTVAPGLELTIDHGVFWIIAKPMYAVLNWLHGVTGNWGVAIIIVTILLKLLFFPLSARGYRSMAAMRKVQPRMVAIRERYGDDRQRMNQAMMELYKTEKINPLGGCLPIVVQIPFFIALYWVLLESVEMRQAPFFLWLNDLSSPDPIYVLPLLMGITMFLQQKLSPAPPDPMQAKVMQILPIAFTVFFAFFPSGLVLYWVVNNTLSIAQQWVITRRHQAS